MSISAYWIMTTNLAEKAGELSLDDRIAIAYSEFRCVEGATNKRVAWREWARLLRKRNDENQTGNTESSGLD